MKKIYSALTFLLLVSMVLAALCTSTRSSCCDGTIDPRPRLQPTLMPPAQPTQAPTAANTDAPAVDTNEPVTIDLWQHDSGGKINGMKAVIAEFNKSTLISPLPRRLSHTTTIKRKLLPPSQQTPALMLPCLTSAGFRCGRSLALSSPCLTILRWKSTTALSHLHR